MRSVPLIDDTAEFREGRHRVQLRTKEVVLIHHIGSTDGVTIAYSVSGDTEPALVFVHGGLADRSFWSNQVDAFSKKHKVIALDLAGHGESGRNRTVWGIQAFGNDIRAVIDAEKINRAVLIGNSLGGPAAVEAALQLPGRIIGIVGVDTFHSFVYRPDASEVRERAEKFRTDFAGATQQMIGMLLHRDADPDLVRDLKHRMARNSYSGLWRMFESFGDYDLEASIRCLKVPIRCLNGDLYPVDMEGNRKLCADFDVVVFPHTGHYPMLECPEAFNRALAGVVEAL